MSFNVTSYTSTNGTLITQVSTNRVVSCSASDIEVFPCLAIGDLLKLGTVVTTVLECNEDGNAFNVSGFINVSSYHVGYKFFDRSSEIRNALMGLPDDVILDLDVVLASVTENGASYEITFLDNPGDIPLLGVSGSSTQSDVFFQKCTFETDINK